MPPISSSKNQPITQNTRIEEIYACAKFVRAGLKKYYVDEAVNKHTWSIGRCREASVNLRETLRKIGIDSRTWHGMYYGADDSYASIIALEKSEYPEETEDWDGGWTHWWVIVENIIVDITADQFHPEKSEDYGIVITNVGDKSYA